jgi:hypothetical protein
MVSLKAHLQLSDAVAQMMQSCMLAAARTWAASVLQGLSLWSDAMRRPPAVSAAHGPDAGRDAPPAAFSTYRSGGGHAVAQVIVPGADAAPAPFAVEQGR